MMSQDRGCNSNLSAEWLGRITVKAADFQVDQGLAELESAGVNFRTYNSKTHTCPKSIQALAQVVRGKLSNLEIGASLIDLQRDISSDPKLQEQAYLLEVVLGSQFGSTVTKNPKALGQSPLFAITNLATGKSEGYIGNGQSNNSPGIHTDGSALPDARVDFMGLLCVRPALQGGESIVSNAYSAFVVMPYELKKFLVERLFYRQNPYDPKAAPVVRPIFETGSNEFGEAA